MQLSKNYQRNVWLLSGTGEGPEFVKALIERDFKVTVSVVSSQAASAYKEFQLESLIIGPLNGVPGIKKVLEEVEDNVGFDLVIDATHPFATEISKNLSKACKDFGQLLIRYERPIEESISGKIIKNFQDLGSLDLKEKNVLLAIGSRSLQEAVSLMNVSVENIFARILPTPLSLRQGLKSSIPENHLAILRPFLGDSSGSIENSIINFWSINTVICRQSGGKTERIWQRICIKNKIDLLLLARPVYSEDTEIVYNLESLIRYIDLLIK